MNHTVEELIKRIDVMKTLAINLHRQAELDNQSACKLLLDDIQSMAFMIAKMETTGSIKTDMRKLNEEKTLHLE
jgi:hypothetical protein